MLPSHHSSCTSPMDLISHYLSSSSHRFHRSCSHEELTLLFRHYVRQEINAFLWLFLFLVTYLLAERFFKVLDLWSHARSIPGPHYLSSGFKLGFYENFNGFLLKLHDNYGPVVKIWWSPLRLFVSVNDPLIANEVLLMAEDKSPCSARSLRMVYGNSNVFFCSYKKSQKSRSSLQEKLNRNPSGNPNLTAIESITSRVDYQMANGTIDRKSVSQQMAFCLLGNKLYGDSFLGSFHANEYEKTLWNFAKESSIWSSYRVAPIWKLDFWKHVSLCYKLQHLNHRATSSTANVDTLGSMFHGCLTLSTLIDSILERLVSDTNLQNEINLEASKNGKQDEMPLLLATVYESLRLMPTKPFLQRCSLQKNLELKNGVVIPSGAITLIPMYLLHTCGGTWGNDSSKFNPFRFLKKNGNSYTITHPNNGLTFLPFGSGARACVAEKFVMKSVCSLFAALLQRYELKGIMGNSGSAMVFCKKECLNV